MRHYASDKRGADFILKMHQTRLAAGLRPNPLGELAAFSQTPRGFKGQG